MAWQLSGEVLETCSCDMICPCIFGPAKPDQGWCAGALIFDIQQGNSDGVNLSGTRTALAFDLPGDFFGGNGTGRLYIGDSANPDQRRELEAVFSGQKGGAFAALGGVLSKVLPTQTANIDVSLGESPTAKIGSIGQFTLQRVKTQDGKQTTVVNAPLNASFGMETSNLARGDGSSWSDPELRNWQSGGTGSISRFSLSA
jgi:hypothetical protein